jgi:hypothetical protein
VLIGGIALAGMGLTASGEARNLALPPQHGATRFGPVAEREGAVARRILRSVRFRNDGASIETPPQVAALDGATVTVDGFMIPFDDRRQQRRFLLGEYLVHCPYCTPGGPASFVEVFARQAVATTERAFAMRGKLEIRGSMAGEFIFALTDATRA